MMKRIRIVRRSILVISLGFLLVVLTIHLQKILPTFAIAHQRHSIEMLRVVIEPEFPPFELIDRHSGQIEGFDIDFLNALAEELKFRVELKTIPFDEIIPSLQQGQADAAISGISITPERQKIISFSRPYFKAGLAIAVPQADRQIVSLAGLEGKRIAVQAGTTGFDAASKIKNTQIIPFKSAPEALKAVSQGKLDACINDAPLIYHAIQTENIPNVKVVGQFVTEEFYGIAMPKDSPHIQPINEGIDTLIHKGKYATIYRKWFGADPPLLPSR